MRRKPMPTRKQRAVRWLWAVVLMLALTNIVLHTGYLLPVQARWYTEELYGTGRTEMVSAFWEPEMHRVHRVYLTENECVTMLSSAYLSPAGWTSGSGITVDCSDEEPLHAGRMDMTWQDTDTVSYFFGRVDDPSITSLRVGFWRETPSGQREVLNLDTSWEDWPEREGRTYFLLRQPPFAWLADWGEMHTSLTAYDREGRVVIELDDIPDGAGFVYGIGR